MDYCSKMVDWCLEDGCQVSVYNESTGEIYQNDDFRHMFRDIIPFHIHLDDPMPGLTAHRFHIGCISGNEYVVYALSTGTVGVIRWDSGSVRYSHCYLREV